MGKSTISMAIFNSYVCLPEGNLNWLNQKLKFNHQIMDNHILNQSGFIFFGIWNHILISSKWNDWDGEI